MSQPWTSVKRLAIVPTFNLQFDTAQPPVDWDDLILRRVMYDPDPASGADRSLRAYLGAISYGRATLDAKLFPRAFSNGFGVVEAAWQSLPAGHGYPYVLCVIPWDDGHPHRHGWFTTVNQNGVKAVARVAMYDGVPAQQQRQITGVWAMEVLHAIADLPDIYFPHSDPELGDFDGNMCRNAGTHNCAYLKKSAGWLVNDDFAVHSGVRRSYKLHAIGVSPPPPGRIAAIQIPARSSTHTFIVEARLKSDLYEKGFAPMTTGNLEFRGLPEEGIVVYEVAGLKNYHLRAVLKVGQTYANNAQGFTVKATGTINQGMTALVTRTPDPRCTNILQRIADIDEMLNEETDPTTKQQLRREKQRLRNQAQSFGCE